jgi:hypothetical protein
MYKNMGKDHVSQLLKIETRTKKVHRYEVRGMREGEREREREKEKERVRKKEREREKEREKL